MTVIIPERPTWTRPTTHETELRAFLGYAGLPAPHITGTVNAVHVTVTSTDDLGEWLDACHGWIEIGPVTAGVRLWVLRTQIRTRGRVLPVLVSVPVVDGALVPEDIEAAIRRAA